MIYKKNEKQYFNALTLIHLSYTLIERPWRSGNVMNCHATAPGSIPGRDGVLMLVSHWRRRRGDVAATEVAATQETCETENC